MESAEGIPRTYRIRRSQHLGYGFIAGHEFPTRVKIIQPNGPSYKCLLPGDVIMSINGIDVERISREQIIRMIQLCDNEIEIKVRQPTYEDIFQAQNLADPKYSTLNKPTNGTAFTQKPHHKRLDSTSISSSPPSSSPSASNSMNLVAASNMTPLSNNQSPFNKLITSIAQQQKPSPFSYGQRNQSTPQVQTERERSKTLSRFNKEDIDINKTQMDNNNNNSSGALTLDRKNLIKYGRFSPLPQRCKSSMDNSRKNNAENQDSSNANDQPLLKRSNTMRPMRPPAKVMEIFEVVIRIFFEDGHTRVLNYNQDTTVGAILETLSTRLGAVAEANLVKQYFGLALTVNTDDSDETKRKRKLLHILDENDSIMKIRQLPYAPKLRLLYRMTGPPQDVNKLYAQNKVAFDYLYKQSCNDLRAERFRPEPDAETYLKLSALQLVEYVYSNLQKSHGNSRDPKVYLKLIKKTPGIEYFVPSSMVEGTLDKRGKKVTGQFKKLKNRLADYLKKNFEEFDFEPPKVRSTTNIDRFSSTSFHELSLPEFQSSPSDYVKLLFLNYLSQLPCYNNREPSKRSSSSPMEKTSVGDCSSSLESVPRTSDSSPLIRQDDRSQHSYNSSRLTDQTNISRVAQMNSMRTINSSQLMYSANEQPEMAQTPSIESISSITFNVQCSPSPQQQVSTFPMQQPDFQMRPRPLNVEPSPMPRHQTLKSSQEYNSLDKLYGQRYNHDYRTFDEMVRGALIPPPPPPLGSLNDMTNHIVNRRSSKNTNLITPILTDQDLDMLKTPPPPRVNF